MSIIYGEHDERTIEQLERCVAAEEGARGVLCADGHVGYSMPIGGVVGYRNFISPSGVGYDIACGNYAVKTNIDGRDISAADSARLADEIQRRISFGVGRKNSEAVDHPVFEHIRASGIPQQRSLAQLAESQLGTVGSGNHYVDVLEGDDGRIWVACHFGSRGFGHKTATGFMNIASGRKFDDGHGEGEMDAPPLLLPVDSPSGQDYIEAMRIAGMYAYAGRETVVNKVLEILGNPEVVDSIHNHHNFAWNEVHDGQKLWVVRKGATPAFPGQRGFVGGSMGDISVILHGVDSSQSRDALYSTVHGAGRVMSRTQAAGKTKRFKSWSCGNRVCLDFDKQFPAHDFKRGPSGERPKCAMCGSHMNLREHRVQVKPGLVDFNQVQQYIAGKGIMLRGAGPDEAPPVYRPLNAVLKAHENMVCVEDRLTPRIVVMAGSDEYDPYKD